MKVRVRVDRSRIAGQGLFAVQAITKGTRIVQYLGERIPKDEGARRLVQGNAYIFELSARIDIDGKTLTNTARYINHSCAPNCDIDKTTRTIWVVALRDITAGEELSYNYGYEYDPKSYTAFPCHCGARNCCGSILAREDWGLIPLTAWSTRG
jgi:SET domain-containing protein